VPEQFPHLDPVLAGLGELRPVAGDRRVEVKLAAIGQDQRAQRGHRLGRGEDVDDRVLLPRLGRGAIPVSAPDVDDRLTVQHHGDRGSDIEALVEVVRQRLGHATEPLVIFALDVGHAHLCLDVSLRCSGGGAYGLPWLASILRRAPQASSYAGAGSAGPAIGPGSETP